MYGLELPCCSVSGMTKDGLYERGLNGSVDRFCSRNVVTLVHCDALLGLKDDFALVYTYSPRSTAQHPRLLLANCIVYATV